MQAVSWRHSYFILNFLLKSENVEQERKKLQKVDYLDNGNILGEPKNIFYFLCAFL